MAYHLVSALLLFAALSLAQTIHSRAAEVERERDEKSRRLHAETNPKWEQRLLFIKEQKILERLTQGLAGFRVKLGGLATGGGFALGPEYLRNDLAGGAVQFRAATQASASRFLKHDVELNTRHKRFFTNIYGVHHNYPRLEYYGPGPDSNKTGRSIYRLEDTAFDGTAGINLLPKLRVAGTTGYLLNNVGPALDEDRASTDATYSESQTPGITRQTNYVHYGGYLHLDLVSPTNRSGGNYWFQYGRFDDQRFSTYSFNRYDFDAQQLFPFFNERRVIALHGRLTLTDPRRNQIVPFYMQPILGGSESLRGYRAYRFRDNNLLLLNAEYRWEVFSGLDMAIFADAGKVAPRPGLINFDDLESSVGFGLRFNIRNNVFLRVDTGFSHEGFQVWLKFNPFLRNGPTKTSSSQAEF